MKVDAMLMHGGKSVAVAEFQSMKELAPGVSVLAAPVKYPTRGPFLLLSCSAPCQLSTS